MHPRILELEKQSVENRQSVSIVIPCFNESEGIASLKEQLLPVLVKLRRVWSVELIFVDDGSTDDTFFQLQQYFGQQAQIIRHHLNQGLSAAIRTGAKHATGEIICTTDSDCTYDPKQIIPLLGLMRQDVDIVTASPYHPQGRVKNVPAWRLFLSKGLSQQTIEALRQRRSATQAESSEGPLGSSNEHSPAETSASTAQITPLKIDQQFWEYNEQLDASLVVIAPPPSSETVLDVLGPIPLEPSSATATTSSQAIMETLKQIYQRVAHQALISAMITRETE